MLSEPDFWKAAALLLSELEENPEYDRAICELVCETVGLSMDQKDDVYFRLRAIAAREAGI